MEPPILVGFAGEFKRSRLRATMALIAVMQETETRALTVCSPEMVIQSTCALPGQATCAEKGIARQCAGNVAHGSGDGIARYACT